MEALLLVAAMTAISLAMTALFDLLAGPRSWPRKAAWALLVVSLPVAGPVLYYLYAPAERPRRRRARTGAAPAPARTGRERAPAEQSPPASASSAGQAETRTSGDSPPP